LLEIYFHVSDEEFITPPHLKETHRAGSVPALVTGLVSSRKSGGLKPPVGFVLLKINKS